MLRSVVREVLNVLGGKTAAIALAIGADPPEFAVRAVAGDEVGGRLAELAAAVAALGRPRRTPAVEADPQLTDAAPRRG